MPRLLAATCEIPAVTNPCAVSQVVRMIICTQVAFQQAFQAGMPPNLQVEAFSYPHRQRRVSEGGLLSLILPEANRSNLQVVPWSSDQQAAGGHLGAQVGQVVAQVAGPRHALDLVRQLARRLQQLRDALLLRRPDVMCLIFISVRLVYAVPERAGILNRP